MNFPITVAAALIVLTAAVFVVLFRRLASPARLDACNPDWLSRYSVAKFKPMERLLSEDDYRFLASQNGYMPGIAKKLRSERRRIFRQYLRHLKRDFGRLEAALRLYVVHSAEDRPDLAKALLRQRVWFTWGLLAVEFRLMLHAFGLGTVDVSGLVSALDSMRIELRHVALARQAA